MKTNNKKKILLVIWGGIHYGGVSILLNNLLAHMNRTNLDISLYAFGTIESQEVYEKFKNLGVNIILGNHKHYNKKAIIRDLYKLIKVNKYDVVHCNTGGIELTAITMSIAYIFRVPMRIAHSHAKKLDNIPYSKRECLYQYLNWRCSNVHLSCSKEASTHLFGTKKGMNIHILNNGIESTKYIYNSNIREVIRRKLNIEDSLIIGHVGRMEQMKNQEFLIKVFSEIKRKYSNAYLLFIGTGSLETNLKDLTKKLKVEESVLFIGTTDEINNYLQAMDIFILPSIAEGLGIVAIEAQASDLLVYCSDAVPLETQITERLHYQTLAENEIVWSNTILERWQKEKNYIRHDRSKEINKAGYDIVQSANYLYNLYVGENKTSFITSIEAEQKIG